MDTKRCRQIITEMNTKLQAALNVDDSRVEESVDSPSRSKLQAALNIEANDVPATLSPTKDLSAMFGGVDADSRNKKKKKKKKKRQKFVVTGLLER